MVVIQTLKGELHMGKLFEIIINNRLTKTVKITDAQAGGQKGNATADHLLILNTIIKHHTKKHNKKEDLHIAFIQQQQQNLFTNLTLLCHIC